MRDFFRGWKRKVGEVALVLAFLLIGLWVRSIWIADKINHSDDGCHYEYGSAFGILYVTAGGDNNAVEVPLHYEAEFLDSTSEPIFWGGTVLFVPHPLIIVPLIFLSSHLLFSEPRASKQPAESPA